jgi:quinoprotein glucose dehydrogenase
MYGGLRPGANLYGESIVAVDLKTGQRRWHFQTSHHPLWDYDIPTAPILVDAIKDGKTIKALAQATKQGLLFVLNRETGEPLWPIPEIAVPQGNVPGEWYSPTQPIPTLRYGHQGIAANDLIDFTPALRAEAVAGTKVFRKGPIFTPPSVADAADGTSGTLVLPSFTGGANWEGGSFDPETNVLYIGSNTNPSVASLRGEPEFSTMRFVAGGGGILPDLQGLPVTKPPYGRITAIDMNAGAHLWQIPNGPTPKEIAEHPALKGLAIPPTGRSTRAVTLVTKTLLFAAEGWGGTPALRAYDKATGQQLAEIALPGAVGGLPMTYAVDGKQYVVVPTAGERGAEIVALSLPN